MTKEQRAQLGAAILAANDVVAIVTDLIGTSRMTIPMMRLGLLYTSASQFRDDLEAVLKETEVAA